MAMPIKKYFKTVAILAGGGTLFAGYLSGVKLVTSECAFREPCPYFLGYPACWYGFFMFLAMLIVAIAALRRPAMSRRLLRAITAISGIGILFAGQYVVGEVPSIVAILRGSDAYGLGLPTCLYGLVFYVIIFALSVLQFREKPAAA